MEAAADDADAAEVRIPACSWPGRAYGRGPYIPYLWCRSGSNSREGSMSSSFDADKARQVNGRCLLTGVWCIEVGNEVGKQLEDGTQKE